MGEPAAILSKADPACQKPTEESISRLIDTAIYEFGGRDARDRLRDKIYWQENDIPHPSHIDFQEVRTGTATEIIIRLKGILAERPTVQVGYTGLVDRKSRAVEKVQDFANALFPALEDDADENTWDNILEDVLRFGRGYDCLEYVPGRWSAEKGYPTYTKGGDPAEYEKQRRQFRIKAGSGQGVRLPVSWRHLPAPGVYAWKDEAGISECISIEERRLGDLGHRYNVPLLLRQAELRGNAQPAYPVEHALFVRYWNRKYATYWISRGFSSRAWLSQMNSGTSLLMMASGPGELAIEPFEHNYGRVPVVETSGVTSTSKNPAKRQLSVLDHVIPLCLYLDQLVSQKASAVRMWAWPTPYLKNLGIGGQVINSAPIGDDMRPVPIEITPGETLMLLPGEEISWLVAPNNGPMADSLLEYITKQADMLGISSSVFDATALQSNGYLYNSVVNSIRSKYNPVINHVRRGHRNRVQHALGIVEMIGEPLCIFKPGDGSAEAGEWLELGPDDIKGNIYQIVPKYEDHMPTDDATDMELYIQATSGPTPAMTREDAYVKYLRGKDPKRNSDRVKIQQLLDGPGATQFMEAAFLHKTGAELDRLKAGDPQGAADKLTPQQVGQAPPAFMQAMQGAGVQLPQAQPQLPGPPATGGGVMGMPAQTPVPGLNRPSVPPPPAKGAKPGPKGPRQKGGRAAGQAKSPPRPAKQPVNVGGS